MKSLLRIREPEVLTTGLFPSLPENQLALWREGENVLFSEGRAEKAPGYTVEATANGEIVAITQAYADNQDRVYYGTPGYLYRWAQGIQSQLGSGFAGEDWSLETFGTFLLATNDVDKVKVWQNAGGVINLPGTNFNRAKIIKKLENHVLVFNTDQDGRQVRWCSKSNINLWAPAVDNSAGGIEVRDLDSDIVAAELLGGVIGFYSQNSFGTVTYLGGSFVFGVKVVMAGIGAVSKDAVVQVSNEHFGWGPAGIWRNNGVSFDYVDTPAIKRWLTANADPVRLHKVRATHHQGKKVVIWSFAAIGGGRKEVAYNYATNAWTILGLGATAWDEPQVVTGQPVGSPVVAVGNKWGFFGDGPNLDTAPLLGRLRTFGLDAKDSDRLKLWNMLRINFEGGGLRVRFGFSDEPGEPDTWTAWAPLEYENWIDFESVYLTMEFRNTGLNEEWAITGLDLQGTYTGWQR